MPSTEYVASEVKNSPNSYRPIVFGQQCETSMNWLRKPQMRHSSVVLESTAQPKSLMNAIWGKGAVCYQSRNSHLTCTSPEERSVAQLNSLIASFAAWWTAALAEHSKPTESTRTVSEWQIFPTLLCKLWMWHIKASRSCIRAHSKGTRLNRACSCNSLGRDTP